MDSSSRPNKAVNLREPLMHEAPAAPKATPAYSVQFEIEDEEEVEASKLTLKDYIIYGAIAIVFFGALYWVYSKLGKHAFKFVFDSLTNLVQSNNPINIIVLILFQFMFGWILFFPGLSTFNVLQAFLMKSFWKAFIISAFGSWLASVSIFWIIKMFFRQRIIEKFRKKILFRVVYVEVKKNPWKMGIGFNYLFIPASVKNYLIALTSIQLPQYCIMVAPAHITYCAMFAFVGYSMTDINEMFHGRPFSQKSTAEKIQSITTYVMLILTFVLMGIFFYVAKNKYHEIEREHKLEAAMQKQERQMTEMKRVSLDRNDSPPKNI